MTRHRAVGITCGVGSMLVGARQAGFDIVGNVEWRKYYHATDARGQNTFRVNFPGALFKEKITDLDPQEIERLMGADLALGHPECGNFSILGGVNKNYMDKRKDATDIPLFVAIVSRLRPRFFVMDDLPKSFVAYPMEKYADVLSDYDLFPELVSNWGYGNIQKFRNRMFMVGALKSERWTFVPGEVEQPNTFTLENVIGDLPEPRVGSNYPNHDPCAMNEKAQKNLSMRFIGDRPTWAEVQEYAREHWAHGGTVMTYFANDGTIKRKPGCYTERWHGTATVQDGGSYKMHPIRLTPLTLRERARIQGFPDDFVFYGSRLNEAGEYNYDRNTHMARQSGKAMPVQFCNYVSRQVMSHICGEPFKSSGRRLLGHNEHVDRAKSWYCQEVGYSDQARACGECWLYSMCSIRSMKYGIGPVIKSFSAGPTSADAATGGDLTSAGPTGLGSGKPSGDAGETGQAARPRRVAARTRSAPARSSRFAELPEGGEFDLFEEGES